MIANFNSLLKRIERKYMVRVEKKLFNGNSRDIAVRAFKTFVQAALATLAVTYVTIDSVDTLQVAVIGAVSAGISAVMNLVKEMV